MSVFDQIERLQEEIEALEAEIRALQKENDELHRENRALLCEITYCYQTPRDGEW